MDGHFARLRKLSLHFEGLHEDDTSNNHAAALARLHQTLASPAPLLEDLTLNGTWDEPFLGSLRPDILGGVTAAPKLRKVEITVFSLDLVCPGLQGATSIITSLGALAPNDTATQNHRVHALFPAVQELEIVAILLELAGEPAARPLARIPVIDAPLASLILYWYPDERDGKESEDVRAAVWLSTTVAHVQNLVQDAVQWASVSEATLAPVLDTARALRIRACGDPAAGELWTEIALHDADRDLSRTAHMRRDHAHALLGKLVPRAQHLRIERLVLDTDPQTIGLFRDFAGSWNAISQLRRLRFDIEWSSVDAGGAFIAPQTLSSLAPMNNITFVHLYAPFGCLGADAPSTGRRIDARFILRLLASVFPNARNATVAIPPHSLSNDYLLSGYEGCAIEYPHSG